MPTSSLERFIERERPDLATFLSEPRREQARRLGVMDQAVLGGWCELCRFLLWINPRPDSPVLKRYADATAGYRPTEPAHGRPLLAAYFGAFITGTITDFQRGTEVRLDEINTALEDATREAGRTGTGVRDLFGSTLATRAVRQDLESSGFAAEEIKPIMPLVPPWQRLLWLAARKPEVEMGKKSDEQLAYHLRLAANQPGLDARPELSRFLPKRAEKLMPLSEDAYRRFRQDGVPNDPELANRLVQEIIKDRRYALEMVSVVEVEELGISRIIFSPEKRVAGRMDATVFECGVLIEHAVGMLFTDVLIHDRATTSPQQRGTVVNVPALTLHTTAADVDEGQAAIELLVLAVWRDLVVPRVRDEQYESKRVRKGKGRGRRGGRRGNVDVIRYLPRNLKYRRARREAANREGRREPSQLYAVATFTRRLPPGQHRSEKAEQHARAIGMPLAPHQTVVMPHFRGGTTQERDAAMRSGMGNEIRTWRSWSALDLLRTRAAST